MVKLKKSKILRFIFSTQVNITAEPGQDVILPCKAPNNKPIRAVEWTRPGLDPDTVLVHRNGRLYLDDQHPSYKNRTDLQDRQMKNGDVSLVLKDVKTEDGGKYECRVSQEGTNGFTKDPISIINLKVRQPGDTEEGDKNGGDKVGITVGSVVGVIILLASSVLIYKRPKRQRSHLPVPPDEAAAADVITVSELAAEQTRASGTLSSIMEMTEPAAAE
ncbi:CD226 antigen-like [Stegastes partitus]|uniref:CD226 antigen-like n=1 Tax=Stegastes partitus TaxID=144197 RepID=A0A9Y4N5Q0_9TELE|nr:PREDICTED: CD226 antigen-like [Stegastes partitus]